jgi:hypothetical protein
MTPNKSLFGHAGWRLQFRYREPRHHPRVPELGSLDHSQVMNSSPRIGLLIAGCWLAFGGIWSSLGVFFPKYRGRWGRRGQGARMSVTSHLLWAVMFIFAGVTAISSAHHHGWSERVFPFVFVPLFATMVIMCWRDSRSKQRDDRDVV